MRLVLTYEIPAWFVSEDELVDMTDVMTDAEIIECAADDWFSVIEGSTKRVERTTQEWPQLDQTKNRLDHLDVLHAVLAERDQERIRALETALRDLAREADHVVKTYDEREIPMLVPWIAAALAVLAGTAVQTDRVMALEAERDRAREVERITAEQNSVLIEELQETQDEVEHLRAALGTATHLLERLDVDPDCWCHPNHFEPHSPLCREITAFVLEHRGPRPTAFRLREDG